MSLTRKMSRKRKRDAEAREMNEMLGHVIMEQAEAFRKKFGREPTENDPMIFDPDADTPTQLSMETLNAQLLEVMKSSGTPPELIYAYQKTGLMVSDVNWDKLSEKDQKAWNAAMDEYFAMEKSGAAEPAH